MVLNETKKQRGFMKMKKKSEKKKRELLYEQKEKMN